MLEVAVLYNEPLPSRYNELGEEKAVLGVLDEVQAVAEALNWLGYGVSRVPLVPPLEDARKMLKTLEADVFFNLFEGFEGQPETEASLANMLLERGLPYTGCPGSAMALCLDKAKAIALLEASGIRAPRYQVVSPETLALYRLGYPCIIKPCKEDASHGLNEESVVGDFTALEKQVARISRSYGGRALVEEYLTGREFNALVMGNSSPIVLPVAEIEYSLPPDLPKILTFEAKWQQDSVYYQGTRSVCPARITDEERAQIMELSLAAFKLLGCRGYARVDMRLDAYSTVNVLEVNPNPDISPEAGAARQARAAGKAYSQFIEEILLLALEK